MADFAETIQFANKGSTGYESHHVKSDDELAEIIAEMKSSGSVLLCLFCEENLSEQYQFRLVYLFEDPETNVIRKISYETSGRGVSVAKQFPTASLYEREITDGFGILFTGSFDSRRLILHEPYPAGFHPLKKNFYNTQIKVREHIPNEELYRFKKLDGKGVSEIAVGPVHAGVIEPGHFRFSVIGEDIFNLETRFHYLHRGIEKLIEDKKPADCLKITESISGDENVANTVCFCLAAEKIAGIIPPPHADTLRGMRIGLMGVYPGRRVAPA